MNGLNMINQKRIVKCRLLILESDPQVRDMCAKFADDLEFELYSTSYVEGIGNVIGKFEPSGIVIDARLFDDKAAELYNLVAKVAPPAKILFLAGDNERFVERAEYFALSNGLHVKGILRRPINENLLKESLERMA